VAAQTVTDLALETNAPIDCPPEGGTAVLCDSPRQNGLTRTRLRNFASKGIFPLRAPWIGLNGRVVLSSLDCCRKEA